MGIHLYVGCLCIYSYICTLWYTLIALLKVHNLPAKETVNETDEVIKICLNVRTLWKTILTVWNIRSSLLFLANLLHILTSEYRIQPNRPTRLRSYRRLRISWNVTDNIYSKTFISAYSYFKISHTVYVQGWNSTVERFTILDPTISSLSLHFFLKSFNKYKELKQAR